MATDSSLGFQTIRELQSHLDGSFNLSFPGGPQTPAVSSPVGLGLGLKMWASNKFLDAAAAGGLGTTLRAARASRRSEWLRKSNTAEAWQEVLDRLRKHLCCQSR